MSNKAVRVREYGSGENLAMHIAEWAVSLSGLRLVADPQMERHQVVTEIWRRGERRFRIVFREPDDRRKETVVVVHLEEDRKVLKLFRWAKGWIRVTSRHGRINVRGSIEIQWDNGRPKPKIWFDEVGNIMMKGPLGKKRALISW